MSSLRSLFLSGGHEGILYYLSGTSWFFLIRSCNLPGTDFLVFVFHFVFEGVERRSFSLFFPYGCPSHTIWIYSIYCQGCPFPSALLCIHEFGLVSLWGGLSLMCHQSLCHSASSNKVCVVWASPRPHTGD